MKAPVFDRFGSGLFVLVVLVIAFVAGQAEPNVPEPAPVEDVFDLGADFRIAIDHERLAKLESMASVIAIVLDTPNKIESSTDTSASSEIPDADNVPAQ